MSTKNPSRLEGFFVAVNLQTLNFSFGTDIVSIIVSKRLSNKQKQNP